MRGLSRPAKIFFLVNLAFSLGMGLYTFVMPAYARQLGASPANFGAILSLASAIGVFVVIPGGAWADRHDLRLLLIFSWGMCLPIPLFYWLAPNWIWLAPGYGLLFLSFFGNPAVAAYIARCARPEELGAVWGRINSAHPLGFIIGPALGSLIIRNFGMPVVFLCSFVCYAVSFGLLFLLPRDPEKAISGPAQAAATEAGPPPQLPTGGAYALTRAATRAIVPVFLVFAAFQMVASVGQNFVSLYLQDTSGLDLGSLGWYGAAGSIGGFFLAPIIGRLRDRRGGACALPLSLLLAAGAYVALLILRQPALLFAALLMRGGESAVYALSGPEISSRAPRESLGRVFASFQVLGGIGGTIGPYLGGVMYGLDSRLPFLTVVVGCIPLAIAGRLALRTPVVQAPTAAPAATGAGGAAAGG